MNQGRLWCVVNPTVGLPLFLGGVALTSLAVHTAVLTHSTWYDNVYNGAPKKAVVSMNGSSSSLASIDAKSQPSFTISVSPVAAAAGKMETAFVVTVTPAGAAAQAKSVTLAQK